MHQDYLRSAVYSSLIKPLPVGCDNGNEASQCGTNRRSKTHHPHAMERVIDKGRGHGEDASMAYLQLSHVSESLGMLKKLHEVSAVIAERRRKPERLLQVEEVEKPRLSFDGCSRNCAEMKKDTIFSEDEKASSTRSLNFAVSFELEGKMAMGSVSTAEQVKKAKSPSLIAKLMGLEEVPLETAQPIKKQEGKKSANPGGVRFDIVMPKAVKISSAEQTHEQTQKSLQEIIESMQFKGLLKSGQVEEVRTRLGSQCGQLGRYVLGDDKFPPIVIVKPMRSTYRVREIQKDLLLGKTSKKEELMHPKTLLRKEARKWEKTKSEPLEKGKNKIAASEAHKQHKNEGFGMEKKASAAQRLPLNRKKQEVKSGRKPISQAKAVFPRQDQSDRRPFVAKSDVFHKRSTPTVLVKPMSQNSISVIKEKKTSGAKLLRKSVPAKATNNTKKSQDGNASNPLHAAHDDSTTSPSMDQIIHDSFGKKSDSAKEAVHLPDKTRNTTGVQDMKRLLLSSQSFLSVAQEVLVTDAHQPTYCQREGLEEVVTRNAKLFLDCGKELLESKSRQGELACAHGQSLYASLDQLVEDIVDGIGKVLSSIVVEDDATPESSLYIRLERDLSCKEMQVTSMWNIGWRNGSSVEESDQIVSEVEEHILSFLVEEMVIDIVY